MDQVEDKFYIFVQRLFERTQSKELIQTLIDNGFDQWDQTKILTYDVLKQINIPSTNIEIIIDILKNIDKKQELVVAYSKPLTLDILTKGLNKKKDYSKRQITKIDNLNDAQVLSLNGLGLTDITDCINIAQQLQILHLYDNNIESIELKEFQHLRILNLQNNKLRIAEIDQLPSLDKVYFDRNYFNKMPVLPPRLQLVSISNQNTQEFQFPDEAFEYCQFSLQHLICENSNVEYALSLGILQNLEILNLMNNKIKEFDDIEDSLPQLTSIREIDLRGNPITTVHKYRDRIVLLCKSIQCIDNKNILAHERQFLINLGKQKIIKRNQSLDPTVKKQPIQPINVVKEKIHLQPESTKEYQIHKSIKETIQVMPKPPMSGNYEFKGSKVRQPKKKS
ncbi:hypothetical protein pb186bvf_014673 [Paramecium bursaria]